MICIKYILVLYFLIYSIHTWSANHQTVCKFKDEGIHKNMSVENVYSYYWNSYKDAVSGQ